MTTAVNSNTSIPAPAATTSSTNSSSINAGLSSLAGNYQTFLTLLTTQLKNQDPLSPMDSSQFTSQLTQMTGVEQQLLSNQLLQQLVNSNQSNSLSSGVAMIGKTVTSNGTTSTLTSGTASWPYTLPTSAATGTVNVLDSGGNVVFTGPLTATNAGTQTYTWNGKNTAGTQLANGGTYTLQISAKDAAGNAISATDGVTGVVASTQQVNGVTMITVNGVQVPLSTVDAVQ